MAESREEEGSPVRSGDSEISAQDEAAAETILRKFELPQPPRIVICGDCGISKRMLMWSLLGKSWSTADTAGLQADTNVNGFGDVVHEWHVGILFCMLLASKMSHSAISEYDLSAADALIFVYKEPLLDHTLDFADELLLAHGVRTYFVNIDAARGVSNKASSEEEDVQGDNISEASLDPYFFDLVNIHEPAPSGQESHRVFWAEIDRLKASLQDDVKDETNRAQIRAMFSGDMVGLAELRETQCSDNVTGLLVTSSAAGAVPAPGIPTLGIMVIVATVLFLNIFRLTPEHTTVVEHADLMKRFRLKLIPRVTTLAASFIAADLGKDVCLVVPVAGLILSVLLGGAISGAGIYTLCNDLIPRLREMATNFYELDANGIVDQKALDEFEDLADRCFPTIPLES